MTTRLTFKSIGKQRGVFYVEVLLSVVLLVILLVPALQSLSAGVMNNPGTVASKQINLRNKMEEVLSQPFSALYNVASTSSTSTTSSFSDASGTANRRIVVLYRYDISTKVISTNDTGLIYVSVYDENDGNGNALNTLVGRWW